MSWPTAPCRLAAACLAAALAFAAPALAACPEGETATADGCASAEAIRARIDAIVTAAMATDHLKAVLVGTDVAGARTLAAWGETMTGVLATPDMRFRNGAVAIAYLGTLLLQLADAGTVRLDAPLAEWLPDMPEADRITLEMLMNGTSGYADYVTDPAFIAAYDADPFRAWTEDDLLAYAFARPMACAPGTCWSYAHTNFVVLGRALAVATGRPLDALLRDGILAPLGLTGTRSALTAEIPPPVLHAFDAERGRYEESTYWNPSWTLAHGAIMTTTIADVLTSATAIGAGTLVSPAAHARLLAPATARFAPWNQRRWYGLGVFVIDGWIVQNPSFSGYAATMAYLPARDLALAVSVTFAPGATAQNPSTDIVKAIAAYLAPEAPL